MALIIVDVNVAPRVLLDPDDGDYGPVHKALFSRRRPVAVLVYGGQLHTEYLQNGALRRVLVQLDRAARARIVPSTLVGAEVTTLLAMPGGTVVSNDHHILALARASGARVLCSEDRDLRTDFRNKALIDNPRGKIYSKRKHRNLLR